MLWRKQKQSREDRNADWIIHRLLSFSEHSLGTLTLQTVKINPYISINTEKYSVIYCCIVRHFIGVADLWGKKINTQHEMTLKAVKDDKSPCSLVCCLKLKTQSGNEDGCRFLPKIISACSYETQPLLQYRFITLQLDKNANPCI